jgi:hypothetical protein
MAYDEEYRNQGRAVPIVCFGMELMELQGIRSA